MIFEVVVYNIGSALQAQLGGADRVEVCSNPAEGGITPSYGTIEVIRQHVSMDVYVMIRPRGGDFCFSSYEFYAMKRDIDQCQRLSVDGIVTGILREDRRIDVKRCKELIDRARPLKVTCHRAFDLTPDPYEALEACIEAGFDRILTSGHAKTAVEGSAIIRQIVERGGKRISIMAGAGVTTANAKQLVSESGVTELHFSAISFETSRMEVAETKVQIGSVTDRFETRSVDVQAIKDMRNLFK